MDNFQIETAQNVTIRQNAASAGVRIGSYLLDLLFMILYYILCIWLLGTLGLDSGFDAWAIYLVISLPVFFYHLLFEVLMNGQSPGKRINRIRVVKLDGSKPTFGNYLLRWVVAVLEINIFSGSLALLAILLNGKGQRLGDVAAGTTVITEKKKLTIHDTLTADLREDYLPTYAQVTMLSDQDIQTIKELYRKAKKTNNHKIILKLHTKIIDITGIKTEEQPIQFVDTVINDYNYYTQQ
ncbi:MAG: RDD family protein [Flavobacteriaceae bacterium]|nr:RDD family protein [Flavobacteriaceae bacterium]